MRQASDNRLRWTKWLLFSLLAVCGLESVAPSQVPLRRIAVRRGAQESFFYDTVFGVTFLPEGASYVGDQFKFHLGVYDRLAADAALDRLRSRGFNTVRVFIPNSGRWNQCVPPGPGPCNWAPDGVGGSCFEVGPGLSAAYMGNFVDFLRRATARGIYVIPVLSFVPWTSFYNGLATRDLPPGVGGINGLYLTSGGVEAKRIYATEFVRTLKSIAPQYLSGILAYELENEVEMHANQWPFSLSSGRITTADGITYDMSSSASRQQCADANLVYWSNSVARAIRAEDPAALVSVSVYTYRAVGRTGPGGVLMAAGPDGHRVPGSPRMLVDWARDLSFVDIHLYPDSSAYDIDRDLRSSEFHLMTPDSPLFLGEMGPALLVSSPPFMSPGAAAAQIVALREAAYQRRFMGSILWELDPRSCNSSYDARHFAAADACLDALAPDLRYRASASLPGLGPENAGDINLGTGWISGAFAPQWIEIDMARERNVSDLFFLVGQYPPGPTSHRVLGRRTLADPWSPLATIAEGTWDGQLLHRPLPAAPRLRYLRVVTDQSPSWVAWYDIASWARW